MTNGSPGGRGHNHLFTASQYGLSHFFMLSLYCCLLALYKNSCQYQVAAEKSETPAGKGAERFHWLRKRVGLRAPVEKKGAPGIRHVSPLGDQNVFWSL